ncbi:hypothetical protein ESCO_000197 [Escovopsis weberi]|uniref:Kinetochore-associated protein NNF1 n=1 Tax=Escovopsis weberi TaxID=150374 RepID=A0A0M8N1M1_ESCWE|nr:hypothetical protein ESCO_000197 [Escovopsis weberi]
MATGPPIDIDNDDDIEMASSSNLDAQRQQQQQQPQAQQQEKRKQKRKRKRKRKQKQQQQQQQQQQHATPPAPGPRAQRMQQLYAQSLRRALSKLGWENFAACFPTAAARAEPVLRQVQAQMVDKLGDKCEVRTMRAQGASLGRADAAQKEFEHIMAARQVVPRLNELEALVADAARRRASSDTPPIPPHTLPPDAVLAAHLLPSLASHQSHLNARLQTTQSRNALLHEHILRQRAEVDALLAELEHAVDDVRGANAVLGAVVEDIAREAREGGVDVEG